MNDRTATPHRERPEIEQAPVITHSQDQQIGDWIMTHKLEACRGCGAFRIEELGLADIIASPHSGRARRPGRGDGSLLTFATA